MCLTMDETAIAAVQEAPERKFAQAVSRDDKGGEASALLGELVWGQRKFWARCIAGAVVGGVAAMVGGVLPFWAGAIAGFVVPLAARCLVKVTRDEPEKISTKMHHNIAIAATAAVLAAPVVSRLIP